MNRRQLLKQGAFAASAFAFSRELFAQEPEQHVSVRSAAGGVIKLSSNENPHGPSPKARKAMMEAVSISNRYPWEATTVLREKIAGMYGLTKDHVTMGAGSSELLGVVSLMAALRKGTAIAPDPTFRLWMPGARNVGLPVQLVPVTDKKDTDLQQIQDKVSADTRMVYLCNPGNPTSNVIPAGDLETFIRKVAPRCLILLDEAYTEFSDEPSMAKLVNEFPNLVIAKTFSKIYGMAGARAGFVLAQPKLIQEMNQLQPWPNAGTSAVSLAGAVASLDDQEFVQFCKKENRKAKEVFYAALEKAGMPYISSHTSFVYFNTEPFGADVRELLDKNNIIGCRTFEEGSKWRRLSVGTVDEMKKVAEVLTQKA